MLVEKTTRSIVRPLSFSATRTKSTNASPSYSTKAIFVDTSTLGSAAYDSRVGDLVQNTTEASLVVQFVEALVRSGVRQDQVGVISLYRQQVKLLGEKLKNVRGSGHEGGVGTGGGLDGVEVLTADKSQGRDKDCIVVSLVRSNPENQVRYPPSYPSSITHPNM
jgi:DNA replication ATP-dependent helicase Dna2